MDEEAPYWKQVYGIARPWRQSPGVRRGCLASLVGAIVLIALIFVVALVIKLT
jgi:hypothetical protein